METDDGNALNGKAALLRSIGLSDTDTSTLAQALAEFNITNAAIITKHNAKTNRTDGDFVAFTKARDAGAVELLARVSRELSPKGNAIFTEFLQREKSNVTISGQ